MSVDLQFLGTCAVDFSPKLKTELADRFDKNARRSSSAVIGGKYLIDCGIHTVDSLRIAGIPLENITDVFFTHMHDDHCLPQSIMKIAKAKSEPLRLWIPDDGYLEKIENTSVIKMPKLKKMTVNDEISVSSLLANHDLCGVSRYLLIEIEGKSILYATDGAWVLNETYNYLRGLSRPLDMLILDCTSGDVAWEYGIGSHNCIEMIRLMLPSFRKIGMIDGNTKIYVTHIAPSHHKPHDDLEKTMREMGAHAAYDGLELQI